MGSMCQQIQNIIMDKLEIKSEVEINRYHRIGSHKAKSGQDRDRPRTVVYRIIRFKDKQRILSNAKN